MSAKDCVCKCEEIYLNKKGIYFFWIPIFKYSPWFQPRGEMYIDIENKKRETLKNVSLLYIEKTINYLTVIGNSTVVLSHPITRFAMLP